MEVLDTKAARDIKKVVSTMAIENMFFSKDFIEKMMKVSDGELSSEDIRQEVLKKYAR